MMKKTFLLLALLLTVSIATTSCRDQKSTGEKIEEAIDETGDAIEDAADEISDEIDDATE